MLKRYLTEGIVEAGCDEAGRGCLAGPVFAAAVILSPFRGINGLNDSKLLSSGKRERLRIMIEKQAVAFAVAWAEPMEIDRINILHASILAMHRALEMLGTVPGQILVDGNRFRPYRGIPFHCIVKGDAKYMSIAAASVLAKTYRDNYMRKIGREYPHYGWDRNKGYPTLKHREAIGRYGLSPHHRRSFRHDYTQMELSF